MNLKDKIVQLLEQQKYTYSDLAGHLNLTEAQLDHVLETKTLEVRTLENISKTLRIPLYSFFRDPEALLNYTNSYKEPFYNVNIWSDEELKYKTEISKLKEEVDQLKALLSNKENLIEALESQLKSSK